jgi:hypothetical protein
MKSAFLTVGFFANVKESGFVINKQVYTSKYVAAVNGSNFQRAP